MVAAARNWPAVTRQWTAATLRRSWREASIEAGWSFPSDWYVPAVDAVCESVVGGCSDPQQSGERLGRARAAAGVSLLETIRDIEVLHDMAPAHVPLLVRSASLGWADRVVTPADAVVDAVTGLVSADYLRVRLGEVYEAACARGESAAERHALVLLRLGFSGRAHWVRGLEMISVGDVARTVFSSGQTAARIGPGTAAVLTERTAVLGRQARLIASMTTARLDLSGDQRVGGAPHVQVWIEKLPPTWDAAASLLNELSR